jgi:hypothetical protein
MLNGSMSSRDCKSVYVTGEENYYLLAQKAGSH